MGRTGLPGQRGTMFILFVFVIYLQPFFLIFHDFFTSNLLNVFIGDVSYLRLYFIVYNYTIVIGYKF